jgi:hypothetical protein
MPAKDNPKSEEQAMQSQEWGQEGDMRRILSTLNQVFSTFRTQLSDEAPKPFDGAAKVAVDTFNDIIAGLKFKLLPRALRIEGRAISSAEIDVAWTDDTNNADGYTVKRCQGYNCQPLEIVRLGSSARVFRDHDLMARTAYRYQVAAFNARGETTSNTIDVNTHGRD